MARAAKAPACSLVWKARAVPMPCDARRESLHGAIPDSDQGADSACGDGSR
jgi:hypothetical protein